MSTDFEGIFEALKNSDSGSNPIWQKLEENPKEATKRLNLDITKSMDEALKIKAESLGMTKAKLVRKLIELYLEDSK